MNHSGKLSHSVKKKIAADGIVIVEDETCDVFSVFAYILGIANDILSVPGIGLYTA